MGDARQAAGAATITRRTALASAGAAATQLILPANLGGSGQALASGPPPGFAPSIAMHGAPKYGPDFRHFDYVDPDAPKGGTLRLEAAGTFDSFNPFILKGTPAAGVSLGYETLTVSSLDEPFSHYGLIADGIETPEDRSFVRFHIDPRARWWDGEPVTPADVIWTFETLTEKGHPRYRAYYASVTKAIDAGDGIVAFEFDPTTPNLELPLILGQLTVLPKHYFENVDFEKTSLKPPLGSGPYRIEDFEAGRFVSYRRVEDYWGFDLAVARGRYNFDEIRYDYYRDRDISLEAFKSGEFDFRSENSAKRWATGFAGPAVDDGMIVVEELAIAPVARMQGYVFNTRKAKFRDPHVRRALGLAFDFEWSNKTLMYDQYVRIRSYFHGEPSLMATGTPSEAELALLEPFRDRLPEEVFTTEYQPPTTDGSGEIRPQLREALRLLREAGWEIVDGVLTETASGETMTFEMLFDSPSSERLAAPYVQNLERLGVRATIKIVDPARYQKLMDEFDFDVTTDLWAQSDSPGNEQRDMWGSEAADTPGSRNTIGIQDPVVDALIDAVIAADSREALEAACKALDRVLLWGHYLVPHFTDDGLRVAYWNKFSHPDTLPSEGLDIQAWWVDPEKEAALEAWRS